jgi:hypothetical protein
MSALVGTWKLRSFESRRANGRVEEPMGPAPVGRLTYDAHGNMSVLFGARNRGRWAAAGKLGGTDDEKADAVDSFDAYFGTYDVDETAGIVTHHVEGALFPNWVGTDQERRFALEGDLLALSLDVRGHGGGRITMTLVWERLTR